MSSSRTARYLALGATIALLQLVVSGCAGVQSEPAADHHKKASKPYYPVTQPMRELGEALWELIDPEDVSHEDHSWADGYATFAYVDGTVEIWWKGPLPARITDEIARHPDVKTVVHEDAKYSQDERGEAQNAVMHWIADEAPFGDTVMPFGASYRNGDVMKVYIIDPSGEWKSSELQAILSDEFGIRIDVDVRKKGPGSLMATKTERIEP